MLSMSGNADRHICGGWVSCEVARIEHGESERACRGQVEGVLKDSYDRPKEWFVFVDNR